MTKLRRLKIRQIVAADWTTASRVAPAQVVGDRVGAGIKAGVQELLAEGDDLLLQGLGGSRTSAWKSSPGFWIWT